MEVAKGAGVSVPATYLVPVRQRVSPEHFPLIIKLNNEHASMGLSKRNIVLQDSQFKKMAREFSKRFSSQVIAQTFVPGREVTVSVVGNQAPVALPTRELCLPTEGDIATERVKFSSEFRKKKNIRVRPFRGSPKLNSQLKKSALQCFKHMGLSGYARMDFRLKDNGEFYLIDVNANPNLERHEDLALAAKLNGQSYEALLESILSYAHSYRPQF